MDIRDPRRTHGASGREFFGAPYGQNSQNGGRSTAADSLQDSVYAHYEKDAKPHILVSNSPTHILSGGMDALYERANEKRIDAKALRIRADQLIEEAIRLEDQAQTVCTAIDTGKLR